MRFLSEILFAVTFCLVLLFGGNCKSYDKANSYSSSSETNKEEVKGFDSSIDLTSHIQQLSGVSVTGSGADAIISIRGSENNSFLLNTQPLFIVNDVPIGTEYQFVYNLVSVSDIISLDVLKGSEASIYGSRGSNGVIVIKTR